MSKTGNSWVGAVVDMNHALMTWHVRGRLKGLMCFHVDDVMISGSKDDPEFKRVMDKVERLCEWDEWEQQRILISVVAEYDKQLTSPSHLIKRATSERSVSSRLVRQAHCETSDKLHCPVILDPVFVSFADASWANRKDFGSQCGYLCVETVGWERRTLLSHFLAFSQVSQSCTFIRFC